MNSRPHLLVAFALGFGTPVLAQLPPHQFSLRMGYSGTVVLKDITTDNDGNIYAVGNFNSTVDLDPGTGEDLHTSLGSNDFFLVKFDMDGNYLWGRAYGNQYDNLCNAIAYDPLSDAIIIGGSTVSSIDFDGIEVFFSFGLSDAFLYKLGTDGTPLWANDGNSESNQAETLTDMVVDADGSIYYTGAWSASASSQPQVALVEISSGGLVSNSYLYGGANSDFGTHITRGPDGTLHLVGKFKFRDESPYNVTFGGFTFSSGSTLDFGNNVFYLNVDAVDGTVLDAKVVAHRVDSEAPSGISVDSDGVVYISGSYGSSFNGSASIFGIGVPEVANSYFNGFVVKLHPDGGANSWARVFPNGQSWSALRGMGVDANGIIHVFCEASPGIDIDPTSSSVISMPAGNYNFLTRLNNDGSFLDGYFYNNIITSRVLPQSNGALILGGNFANDNDFDPGPDVVSLPSAGGGVPDAFVSKLFDVTTIVTETTTDELTIAPNPASSCVNISGAPPNARYALLDLPGKMLVQGRLNGESNTIDVSELAAGTYVLQVQGADGRPRSECFVVSARQ